MPFTQQNTFKITGVTKTFGSAIIVNGRRHLPYTRFKMKGVEYDNITTDYVRKGLYYSFDPTNANSIGNNKMSNIGSNQRSGIYDIAFSNDTTWYGSGGNAGSSQGSYYFDGADNNGLGDPGDGNDLQLDSGSLTVTVTFKIPGANRPPFLPKPGLPPFNYDIFFLGDFDVNSGFGLFCYTKRPEMPPSNLSWYANSGDGNSSLIFDIGAQSNTNWIVTTIRLKNNGDYAISGIGLPSGEGTLSATGWKTSFDKIHLQGANLRNPTFNYSECYYGPIMIYNRYLTDLEVEFNHSQLLSKGFAG